MKLGSWLKIVAVLIAAVTGASVYFAWRGAQREQAQLKSQLQAAQKALSDADARQQTRNAQLAQLLAQFNERKSAIQSPAQIVKALPEVLPLPTSLALPGQNAGATPSSATPSAAKEAIAPPTPKVQLPPEDLKPLYDFAVNCQACQAQLTAAQADLKDEQTKTQTLGRERDAALQAARGGSVMRRVARAAKWFVIGAAAGALAARLAH